MENTLIGEHSPNNSVSFPPKDITKSGRQYSRSPLWYDYRFFMYGYFFTTTPRIIVIMMFLFLLPIGAQASQYWTGNGGRGMRLAVLEPSGRGIPENEQWMLSLIQGSITGDFNKYSAMTIIDRQNIE